MNSESEQLDAIAGLLPWEAALERSEDHGRRTRIHVFRSRDEQQPDVVAKHDRTWTEASVRSVFESHGRVSQALASFDRLGAASAIGWSSEPPIVVMELAEGSPVSGLARDAARFTSAVPRAMDAVGLSGRALAVLHAVLPVPTEGDRDVVRRAEQLFRLQPSWANRSDLPRVCHVTDYATYNQFYSEDHGLVLIDPPVEPKASVPHDDVAYYLSSLMNSVVGSNGIQHRRSASRLYARLAEEFLSEYSSAGPYDLRGTRDRELVGLIAGYHSARWGWRRLKRRPGKTRGLRMVGLNAVYWGAKSRVVSGAQPWLSDESEG